MSPKAGAGGGTKPQQQPKPATPIEATRAKRHGIVIADVAYDEAKRAGLEFAVACAILMRESSGGNNVFGHDPTIFVGAGAVTKEKYAAYKAARVKAGNRLMQGVGPVQLTYFGYQDQADAQGGCWDPRFNCRIGFQALAGNIKAHGLRDGIRRYNGSGPAAEAYADAVVAAAGNWRKILAGQVGDVG